MKSKTVRDKQENNLARAKLPKYISKSNPGVYPYLKKIVVEMDCKYYNTRILDDKICEEYPEWKTIFRNFRLSIIFAILTEEFKFEPWTKHSKKVVYDPSKPDCY